MNVSQAFILGIVQGITEFLPVSSSGHLVLLQRIFGISEPALIFETAVHGGTLIAVFAVLWRDILSILRRITQPLTLYIIIATIPAVIVALALRNWIEDAFQTGAFLGFAFLVTSALLFLSEKLRLSKGKSSQEAPFSSRDKMNWIDALVIGLFQAFALIPGISRSGATISGALFRGLDRSYAARFSFLLSIPAILGALVLHARGFVNAATATEGSIGALPLVVGTLISGIVAFFSMHLLFRILKRYSLCGFAVYTGILGLLVLADQYVTRIFL